MEGFSPDDQEARMDRDQSSGLIYEFVCLFLIVPLSLVTPLPLPLKILIVAAALTYVLYIGRKKRWLNWRYFLPDHPIPLALWLRLGLFMAISTTTMAWFNPDDLFKVLTRDPALYVMVIFVYLLLSVLPQEWLFRFFYQERYQDVLPKGAGGVILNGVLFSLAHLIFFNPLVLWLTFAGGCLFYRTYRSTGSLYVASVEHAVYGIWLFTLGMGDMLAFPG